jgi:hypothetical protein
LKKFYCSLSACFLLLTVLSTLCVAASIEQVAGDYALMVQEKVSIKKIGKDSWQGASLLTINANGTWFEDWGGQGTAALDTKGKKLYMGYDSIGQSALEDDLVDWAYDAAAAEGVSASGLSFTFTDLQPAKCKIDKKTNRLSKKYKVKGTGIFSGTLDGTFVTTKFKYQMKALVLE